jgi:glycosyltransferase involved in cell wall biosynthesis
MRISLVLWDGNVGGAERVTAELAAALRSIGVDATVVFVRDPATLAADLERLDVPYVTFGARRVEEVVLRPRRFARLVESHGPDGALLPTVGHQAPALRLGGYRAPLVAMEHGFLLLMESMAPHWRLARRLERRASAPFIDAEVAVSGFMREAVENAPHARRVEQIGNGIDLSLYSADPRAGDGFVVGCATRLVPGKGIDTLLEAFSRVVSEVPHARLRLAGDGPERGAIEAHVARLGAESWAELAGVVSDLPEFWSGVDVAVMPSTLPESFGMVALEAMASGRPVVATRSGGVEELVEDGVTGRLVPVGDVEALSAALAGYASSEELRVSHGEAGRSRAERQYSITDCAWHHARLFATLGDAELPAPAPAPAREEVHA